MTEGAMTRPDGLLATLAALECELHHPGARCSRQRLEALLHPDFREVGRSGQSYDRETVIRYLAEHGGRTEVVATDHAVHAIGHDAALLTYRSGPRHADGRVATKALRSSLWVRTASGWQLLYHQGTPAPGSA
jgi:hypothetical protein